MLYSVWIYGPRIGWWLLEDGYDSLEDASASLAEKIISHNERSNHKVSHSGAIIEGKKFPMPMCDACLKSGRIHYPATA